jgi:hypothetical protein
VLASLLDTIETWTKKPATPASLPQAETAPKPPVEPPAEKAPKPDELQ